MCIDCQPFVHDLTSTLAKCSAAPATLPDPHLINLLPLCSDCAGDAEHTTQSSKSAPGTAPFSPKSKTKLKRAVDACLKLTPTRLHKHKGHKADMTTRGDAHRLRTISPPFNVYLHSAASCCPIGSSPHRVPGSWPYCAGDAELATQPPQECNSEQAAATILGFTQASWDNESGNEEQPSSADKGWKELTERERAAALVLGYTSDMWDTGTPQPASTEKGWAELSSCGDAHRLRIMRPPFHF